MMVHLKHDGVTLLMNPVVGDKTLLSAVHNPLEAGEP